MSRRHKESDSVSRKVFGAVKKVLTNSLRKYSAVDEHRLDVVQNFIALHCEHLCSEITMAVEDCHVFADQIVVPEPVRASKGRGRRMIESLCNKIKDCRAVELCCQTCKRIYHKVMGEVSDLKRYLVCFLIGIKQLDGGLPDGYAAHFHRLLSSTGEWKLPSVRTLQQNLAWYLNWRRCNTIVDKAELLMRRKHRQWEELIDRIIVILTGLEPAFRTT